MSVGALPHGQRAARETSQRFGGTVATIAALTATPAGFRADGQVFFVRSVKRFFEFVFASSATASNDTLVPDAGSGRFVATTGERAPGTDLADGNATILVTEGRLRVLPAATLSTNRTITFGTTGAAAGDIIRVVRRDATANTLAMINGGAGAGTMATLPASKVNFFEAIFDGTNWALYGVGSI